MSTNNFVTSIGSLTLTVRDWLITLDKEVDRHNMGNSGAPRPIFYVFFKQCLIIAHNVLFTGVSRIATDSSNIWKRIAVRVSLSRYGRLIGRSCLFSCRHRLPNFSTASKRSAWTDITRRGKFVDVPWQCLQNPWKGFCGGTPRTNSPNKRSIRVSRKNTVVIRSPLIIILCDLLRIVRCSNDSRQWFKWSKFKNIWITLADYQKIKR